MLIFSAHQLNDLSLDLLRRAAPEGNAAVWQPVQAECSQKGFCCGEKPDSSGPVTLYRVAELQLGVFTSGARPSVLQVEAKRALAVEGALRVHAAGADGAGAHPALIRI